MALIQCDFASQALGVCTSINVLLPQATPAQIGMAGSAVRETYPTLYLLHGLSDDHTTWLRRTSIERYVASMGLAVVMPRVDRSWYTNMPHGMDYWTFVSEELPQLCRHFFPLSPKREDTFVAGLSMGGYGAFKLALRKPEQFAAAASMSGTLDIAHHFKQIQADDPWYREWVDLFGTPEQLAGSDEDVMALATRAAASDGFKPALYQCCGSEDHRLEHNHRFRDHVDPLALNLTYEEDPGYNHSWDYWDMAIQRVLAWLPLESA